MPPTGQFLIGLLMAALVAGFVVTGSIGGGRGMSQGISKDRSPRTFWAISLLFAVWAAYLIYRGIAEGALTQLPRL